MAYKVHLSPDGIWRQCKAVKEPCKYGGNENHQTFKSKEDFDNWESQENKKNFGMLAKDNEPTKEVKETSKERLTRHLNKQWFGDEEMVKHCLRDSKYVEIGDAFVDVGDAKPKIHSRLYYDDESESPGTEFEAFYNYNVRMGMPKHFKMRGRNIQGTGTLKMMPQYGSVDDFSLSALTYEDDPKGKYREVTEEQLEKINAAITEIQKDYTKRLNNYYKRYKDKIHTVGYWVNR